MLISNKATSGFILGTLNTNINKKIKAAGQLALGEKIRNAGDDTAGYAISERMRVRIRSLDQADANVQNGASMLRIAEGAIQSQINLLRTVKEKVIDAHNDTNTDADRMTIQKEITEYYNEINDIAAETTFNGKHLLLGTKVVDAVKSWYRLDHAEKMEGSDALGLISGTISSLDGQEGPFATFGAATDDVPYDGYNVISVDATTIPGHDAAAGATTAAKGIMHGATANKPNTLKITLTGDYTQYNNKAFKVIYPGGEDTFVLTTNTSQNYRGIDGNHKIDISGVYGLKKIYDKIYEKLDQVLGEYIVAGNRDSTYLELTTKATGESTNYPTNYNVVGVTLAEGGGYTGAGALTAMTVVSENKGANGKTAAWDWDLTSYNNTSTAENLISSLLGKAFTHSNLSTTYEFIDRGNSKSLDSVSKLNGSTTIDLNQIRSAVSSGKTVAEAFAGLLTSNLGSSIVETVKNSSNQVTGVKIKATVPGLDGNGQSISFKQGELRHYDLDFKSFFSSKGISDDAIAVKMNGKGFRFYDVTDKNKWVNVLFVNGKTPEDEERPASGTSDLDIDTLVVDLSDVTDLRSFMDTLYKGDGDKNPVGLSQLLQSTDSKYRLAVDYDNGIMTIYDVRPYTVLNGQTERGAKIADGIMDNVVFDYRNTYVNELVIQHTDKSSANIHVQIAQTTMDQIFGYKIGDGSLDDYSVLTAANREFLLGQDYPIQVKGALDRGIQYLLDANTLIGAQINHMENADANLVTELENTMAAESVIRDADIAKSAIDFVKYNILTQSTQAMLSQFNNNSSDVLSLLN